MYVSNKESKTIVPVKELKGFEKVAIKAGATETVKLELSLKDSCSWFDEYFGKWIMEAGKFEAQIGKSSDDIEFIESFEIKTQKLWTGI